MTHIHIRIDTTSDLKPQNNDLKPQNNEFMVIFFV